MNQRERVARLAKTDFTAAFKLTGSIVNVRERIQSLGWVARYAPVQQIPRVIAAAEKLAGKSSDLYEDVAALAWPLRALYETGNSKSIPSLLKTATRLAADVSPASSRAEATNLLIHAVLPAGLAFAEPAISSLTKIRTDSHWRVVRNFIDVSLLVNAESRPRALAVAELIPNPNKRKSALERICNGEQRQPRDFFW